MNQNKTQHRSILVNSFSNFVEFSNKHFTLAKYLIKDERDVFYRIEKMMLWTMVITIIIQLTIHLMPVWLAITLAILLAQRVFEFVIVYARNFIFGRGRVFTDFKDAQQQGEWLIMMFSLNILQVLIIYSVWYRLLSILDPQAFLGKLTILNSLYFTVVSFLTVGYGDILPVSDFAKILVLTQGVLTFYTLVIVVNGLISIHFRK